MHHYLPGTTFCMQDFFVLYFTKKKKKCFKILLPFIPSLENISLYFSTVYKSLIELVGTDKSVIETSHFTFQGHMFSLVR